MGRHHLERLIPWWEMESTKESSPKLLGKFLTILKRYCILCLTCQPFTEFFQKCCDLIGSSQCGWHSFSFRIAEEIWCYVQYLRHSPLSWSNYVLIISFLGDVLTEIQTKLFLINKTPVTIAYWIWLWN